VALQGQGYRDALLCGGRKKEQDHLLAQRICGCPGTAGLPASLSAEQGLPCPALHSLPTHLVPPCRSMLQCAPCTFWPPSAGGCPPS
jgi:hypothetical protein